jgi:non-ribosomal peptide synthetase component F
MTTEPRTWRALVLEADRARRELRPGGTPCEILFDPDAGGDELPDGVVLRVGFTAGEGLALRLHYRTDALDDVSAARIAGYHLAALATIAADPDAAHARQVLLSAEELRFQLHGLAGRRRPLPDCGVHALFEERVRAHAQAIAVVHGHTQWTYGELNRRANQLAWALLGRELRTEEVVAVVADRTPGWMSAVLAVFKAGGAYLPIEPDFPADRIARMLSRAGCRWVLAERGRTATLDEALESLPGVHRLTLDVGRDEDYPEFIPDTGIVPGHLA